MRSKFLLGAFLSAAVAAPVSANIFDGFYVGGAVGLNSMNVNSSYNLGLQAFFYDEEDGIPVLDGVFPLGVSYHNSNDFGKDGFSGDIFFGYGIDFCEPVGFYLGFEIDAEFNNAEAGSHSTFGLDGFVFDSGDLFTTEILGLNLYANEVSVQNSYTFSVLPGYRPNEDLLLYGRAGVVWGKIETSVDNVLVSEHNTTHKLGGRFGLGAEYAMTENLSLRAEYNYTLYQSVNNDLFAGILIPDILDIFDADSIGIEFPSNQNLSIYTNIVNVGVSYRF
jgi:opacity protein-like surface antigen